MRIATVGDASETYVNGNNSTHHQVNIFQFLFNPKHIYRLNVQETAQQTVSQSSHFLEFELIEVFEVDFF